MLRGPLPSHSAVRLLHWERFLDFQKSEIAAGNEPEKTFMGICKDLWEFQSCSLFYIPEHAYFEESNGFLQHQFIGYF